MKTDLANSILMRHPDLIAADMDGEMVMMSIERGTYYGIGGVGCRVWELLERPSRINAIVATICSEYNVDESTCMADVQSFVIRLLDNGLIVSK